MVTLPIKKPTQVGTIPSVDLYIPTIIAPNKIFLLILETP